MKDSRIGFSCGVFDLFNAGHVLMLEKCRQQCDYLIVGIQTNPTLDRPKKNKPIQSIIERQIEVVACKYVNKVIIYETEQDLEDILDIMKIDVRFVGKDHENGFMTAESICERRGIQIIYLERGGRWSSSELRERVERGN